MKVIDGITLHAGLSIGTAFIHSPVNDIRGFAEPGQNTIVIAQNLTPAETVRFGGLNVSALVVTEATQASHTAILSRTMNWPALSAVEIDINWHGKTVIVDGYKQRLIVEPDRETINSYLAEKKREELELQGFLSSNKGKTTSTKSGKTIHIFANISTLVDVEKVIAYDAEGIGNFKTEFMYLEKDKYPTEEELFQAYAAIVTRMDGKKVVIRTFDIGTDKVTDYFNLEREDNPALGYRAVRIGLDRPQIFKTQLKAILRASALGNVAIMYPMIVSVEEVIEIKELLADVMSEMKNKGIAFDENIEQGIMVETPAAVIMSYELAKEVDFFSIGTNDLIQYTLAADRENPKVAKVYNPYHPAIMRSIRYVVDNAHKLNVWVEISGELGADITQICEFIDMGIDALAVSPSKIPSLKKFIAELE